MNISVLAFETGCHSQLNVGFFHGIKDTAGLAAILSQPFSLYSTQGWLSGPNITQPSQVSRSHCCASPRLSSLPFCSQGFPFSEIFTSFPVEASLRLSSLTFLSSFLLAALLICMPLMRLGFLKGQTVFNQSLEPQFLQNISINKHRASVCCMDKQPTDSRHWRDLSTLLPKSHLNDKTKTKLKETKGKTLLLASRKCNRPREFVQAIKQI